VEVYFRGGPLDGQVKEAAAAPDHWVENLQGVPVHYRRVGDVTGGRGYYELPRLTAEELPVVKRTLADLEQTLGSVPPEHRTPEVWGTLEGMEAYLRAAVKWTEHDVSDPGIT
jgi:hypothetical protein